jgi:hypothetical protein
MAVVLFAAISSITDAPPAARKTGGAVAASRSACEGDRPELPNVLAYELRAGAFPDSHHPDVAVHVPPGFDGTRRPGVVLYFHGWNGCVATALGAEDAPCTEGGDPRRASALAAQIDEAGTNALLIAIELRVDAPTGEPGQLAMPGNLRALLGELFEEHLSEPIGCTLHVDELDRIVVVAHSGGYQAAASAIRYGDLPRVTELDLLDAFYGADEVFHGWVSDALAGGALRFVDLYTGGGGSGGTKQRSRQLAADAHAMAGAYGDLVYDDDSEVDLPEAALARAVVFKRVPREHADLPRAYVRSLVQAAGFAARGNRGE